MKALCLVAHPDDCVIFALSFMHQYRNLDWTVAYLTYQEHEPRAKEFHSYWNQKSIKVRFLGYEDHWHDNEQKKFTRWSPDDAMSSCWNLAAQYDLVLTHDQHGDYGHIHHKLVYQAVQHHANVVTFAPPGQGTDTYTVPEPALNLDQLPLHKDIILSFHSQGHKNSYHVNQAVKTLLEDYNEVNGSGM